MLNMLFSTVVFSHGYITSLKLRTTPAPVDSPISKVYSGTAPTLNVTLTGVGALKTVQNLQDNLKATNAVFKDAAPCRYNNVWASSNTLKAGPLAVTWNVTEAHPGSTCAFFLLKNGEFSSALSSPFDCAATIAPSVSKTITIPECSAADKCTIQWTWSSDGPQFLNCMDFSTGGTTTTTPTTGVPASGTPAATKGRKCKPKY